MKCQTRPGFLARSRKPSRAAWLAAVFLLALSATILPGARAQAPGSLDAAFNPGSGAGDANSSVSAVAIQADGRIILGGDFATFNGVARSKIARLNPDGSLDATFNPGTGANDFVDAVAIQTNGRIVICGRFTMVDGVARNGVARLNADGSLDTAFNPGTGVDGDVNAVAIQPDGGIVIGGGFATFNGVARRCIARLNTDGGVDTGFNPGTGAVFPGAPIGSYISPLAIEPDGRIVITGFFLAFNGVARNGIARLNTDGSLDTAFNPGAGVDNNVEVVAIQPDGRILFCGRFTMVNGVARNHIARFNADGSLDTSFNPGTGVDNGVGAVAIQADGRIILGGDFTTANGVARNHIARLNADGSLDAGFNPGAGADNYVNRVAIQTDGGIVIIGGFTTVNGVARNGIARLIGGNGGPGAIQFSAPTYNVNENGGTATITASRAGGSLGAVSASYATADGTALAGADYTAVSGTLAWADGDAADKTFTVPVTDRQLLTGSKTVVLNLAAPTGGATLGANVPATLTILENDAAPQPTISITSPPSNVTLVAGTTTTFGAAVTDPGGLLAKVEFFLNGVPYPQSTPVAGPFTLAATVPAQGNYTLTATATDTQGRQSSSTSTFTVVPPPTDPANPAPVAGFVTPFDGRTLAGGSTVMLTATADSLSPSGASLARVDFYADNTLLASFDGNGNPLTTNSTGNPGGRRAADAGTPVPARNGTVFSAPFPIPNLTGFINLLIVVTNQAGLSQTSAPVTVRTVATGPASNHAPVVRLGGGIASGQKLRAGVKITIPVSASDPDAGTTAAFAGGGDNHAPRRNALTVPGTVIASVEYFLNQLKVGSSTTPPFGFDFTPPSAGTYVIDAVATDDAGLSGVADPVIVQAGAAPPTVSLALPGAGGGVSATVAGGGAPLKVTVTRAPGDDLSLPLTVAYKVKGNAVAGTDYKALSGKVTIPAGALSAKVKVKSLNNGQPGASETLKLKLLSPADGSYNVGAPAQVKIRILD